MALSNYIFYRSNVIFLLALICGAILPQGFSIGNIVILPALMVILTITLLRFPRGFFRHPGPLLSASIRSNVMNFLVLGNFIILASIFLIHKQEIWVGMVLIAAMPPSVAIIPLSNFLRADKTSVFTGLAGAYLGALLIIPLIGLGFLKYIHLNYWNLILLVLELIFLPLALSRLAVDKAWDKIIEPYEETIIDYCSFIVFYTITAGSRNILPDRSPDLFVIALIAFVSIFFFAFVIGKIGNYFHDPENKNTSFLLLGTMKDCGLAGGIALILFNQEVALPSLIFAICTFIYMNWLKYKMRHIINDPNNQKKDAIKI
jgi:bile acid:Na+ symporter, BASS family